MPRNLIDYFRLMSSNELQGLLIRVTEDNPLRKLLCKADRGELEEIYFSELLKSAGLSLDVSEQDRILRSSLEVLMKELRVPFVEKLNDEALFRLFRIFISEKLIERVKPMLMAGYLMMRCDGESHEKEDRILSFFIKNLDVLDDVKQKFSSTFFAEAEALYKQAQSTTVDKVLNKLCASQDEDGREQLMRFTYSIAMADGVIQRQELAFHETIGRVLKIAPARVLELRDEVGAEHKRDENEKQLGEILGCQHYNELIACSEVAKFSRDAVLAVVALSTGILGALIAYSTMSKANFKKLNAMLTPLAFKAEDEVKEERIVKARNVFEKLSAETGEMLSLCSNIHYYLENMNKAYAEVADQAWLKGLWGQLSTSNRKALTVGGALLTVVVRDVGQLLAKIMQHQQTLTTAIDEHLYLISVSVELQAAVHELAIQNKQMHELIQEAESAGVLARAA